MLCSHLQSPPRNLLTCRRYTGRQTEGKGYSGGIKSNRSVELECTVPQSGAQTYNGSPRAKHSSGAHPGARVPSESKLHLCYDRIPAHGHDSGKKSFTQDQPFQRMCRHSSRGPSMYWCVVDCDMRSTVGDFFVYQNKKLSEESSPLQGQIKLTTFHARLCPPLQTPSIVVVHTQLCSISFKRGLKENTLFVGLDHPTPGFTHRSDDCRHIGPPSTWPPPRTVRDETVCRSVLR